MRWLKALRTSAASPARTVADSLERPPFATLYPFASHYQQIGKWRYHYLDEGRGEPLIMLHGNPTWSFYYRSLVQGLAPKYRTIVPDHLGCGLSDRPSASEYGYRLADRVRDLAIFIDRLQLDQPLTLIVHDWGGMIGCAYAIEHPQRIARLVIMNTAAFLKPAGKALPLRLALLRGCRPMAGPLILYANLFAQAAALMASHRGLSRAVRTGLLAPYQTPSDRLAILKFVQDIPLRPTDPSYALAARVEQRLPVLTGKPMLLIWGQHDFVFDLDYLEQWQQRFPAAECHLLPAAGHYLLEDEPQQILGYIQDFLKKHPLDGKVPG